MTWVIDPAHVVHVPSCRLAEAVAPYKTGATDMREHLQREDVKDRHPGPTMLTACDLCIPSSKENQ